jgi:SNF2 family DNA or RNA helicase
MAELHYILRKAYMIRRLKKDVLDQLPDKRRQQIEVQTDPKIVKKLNQLLDSMRDGGISNISNEDPEQVMTRLMGFKQKGPVDKSGGSFFDAYMQQM